MINPAVFTTTFLAAAVEIIEMVIIVVGVGAIRGWRSTLLGTGAGLAVVAALILALGTALTFAPINVLRLVAGSASFLFRPASRRQRPCRDGGGEHTRRRQPRPRPGTDRVPPGVPGCRARGPGSRDHRGHLRRGRAGVPLRGPGRGRRPRCHRRRRRG